MTRYSKGSDMAHVYSYYLRHRGHLLASNKHQLETKHLIIWSKLSEVLEIAPINTHTPLFTNSNKDMHITNYHYQQADITIIRQKSNYVHVHVPAYAHLIVLKCALQLCWYTFTCTLYSNRIKYKHIVYINVHCTHVSIIQQCITAKHS